MAFNPFHRFRKHQKVFLAALAVLCMIIFVFQFGAGDVFTRALQWVGGSGARGDLVTTLYGEKFYERDLATLKRHRQIANDFLLSLGPPPYGLLLNYYLPLNNLRDQLSAQRSKPGAEPASPPLPAMASGLPTEILQRYQQMLQGFGQPNLDAALQGLQLIRTAMEQTDFSPNPEQMRNLQTLAAALAVEAWFAPNPKRPKNELLLGGTPDTEDLLDFQIWKHQADRLGVSVADADVGREINQLLGNPTPPEFGSESFLNNKFVRGFLRLDTPQQRRADTSPLDLLEALRQEFRVQLAKEALLGHGSGVRAFYNEAEPLRTSPAVATPEEFLDYFRRQRTTLRAALLNLAVGNFVDKVEGQPSEQELLNRYETYKGFVPEPDQQRPGFKEPRRIRVQYARIDSESAFYQAKGKELARIYQSTVPAAVFRAGAGGLHGWAALAALPEAPDPLEEEYQRYRSDVQNTLSFNTKLSAGIDLRDRRPATARPQVFAGAVGILLGSSQTGLATPLSAASMVPGLQAAYRSATLQAFGSQVLAGATVPSWTAPILPVFFSTTQPLSRTEAQPLLLERFQKSLAERAAQDNIRKFDEEVAKKRGKPAEAQQYVQKAVKEFGMEDFTTTTHLESKYQVVDDPALAKLREFYDKWAQSRRALMQQLRPGAPDLVKSFADMLFEGNQLYEPNPLTDFSGQTQDTWLVWRIEDKMARERPFDEVRREVEASWRFDRARLLARAEAERLRKAIDEKHLSPEAAMQFLRDQKEGSEFELNNVARMLPRSRDFLPGREDRPEYRPYEVPADKIAYPPTDFVDRLLNLQEPGNVLVLADRPAKHYYVVVLLAKSVPPLRDFEDLYAKPAMNDPIWVQMMHDRRTELQQDLMKQLRREAAGPNGIDAQGNLKLPESIRKASEPSSEE